MIAIDTNLLVYAHRNQTEWHHLALDRIQQCWGGDQPWMIPWPCLHEFYSVVTHPKVQKPPSTIGQTITQIETWMESPTLVISSESGQYWSTLRSILESGRITGSMVYDAKIAAICLSAGVTTFWTADRDFSRFPKLRCENPLVYR